MRRQTMQPFFILLIMVVSLILNFSSLAVLAQPRPAKVTKPSGGPASPRGTEGKVGQVGKHSEQHRRSAPAPLPPSAHPPASSVGLPPSSPPPPLPLPSSLPPPPPPKSLGIERVRPKKNRVGKVVGLAFLGIAGVLQVGVVSFLVFKRWQIPRVQDETGVRLVS